MILRTKNLVVHAVVVAAVASACSSKSEPPAAYIDASITNQGQSGCNQAEATNFLPIGYDTNEAGMQTSEPERVSDGATQGGTVEISCSIKPTGSDNYNLDLSARVVTTQTGRGGAISIQGTVNGMSGASQTITASFNDAGLEYTEQDCSITYDVTPQGGPVVAGRIWAHLTCPSAVLQGQLSSSGGMVTCNASAEFIFENCSS